MKLPILKTKRLILNQVKLSDVEEVFFSRSNAELMQYIKREPYTEKQQAVDFIEMIMKQVEDNVSVNWALRSSENGKMMGSICIWNFSEDRKTGELGYDLLPDFQGKGFMDEAVKAVINFGFNELNLTQIEAFTSQYNEASKALLLKNNFVLNTERFEESNLDNRIFELKKL